MRALKSQNGLSSANKIFMRKSFRLCQIFTLAVSGKILPKRTRRSACHLHTVVHLHLNQVEGGRRRIRLSPRVIPRRSASRVGDRFDSADPFRKPETVSNEAVPVCMGNPSVWLCAQMFVGDLPTGREPARHEASSPGCWEGYVQLTPASSARFATQRRTSANASTDSQPVESVRCISVFMMVFSSLVHHCVQYFTQAMFRPQKRRRSIPHAFRFCPLVLPAKQPV